MANCFITYLRKCWDFLQVAKESSKLGKGGTFLRLLLSTRWSWRLFPGQRGKLSLSWCSSTRGDGRGAAQTPCETQRFCSWAWLFFFFFAKIHLFLHGGICRNTAFLVFLILLRFYVVFVCIHIIERAVAGHHFCARWCCVCRGAGSLLRLTKSLQHIPYNQGAVQPT